MPRNLQGTHEARAEQPQRTYGAAPIAMIVVIVIACIGWTAAMTGVIDMEAFSSPIASPRDAPTATSSPHGPLRQPSPTGSSKVAWPVAGSPSLTPTPSQSPSPPASSPSPSPSLPEPSPNASLVTIPEGVPEAFRMPAMWEAPDPSGPNGDLPPQFRLPLSDETVAHIMGSDSSVDLELVEVRGVIRVTTKGRLGNNLFMVAAARALHELTGFKLELEPKLKQNLAVFRDITDLPAKRRPKGWQPDELGKDIRITRHQRVDIFKLSSDRRERRIVLDGYAQQLQYLRPFLSAFRSWFQLANSADTGFHGEPGSDDAPLREVDVLAHVRAGDLSGFTMDQARRGIGGGLVPMPLWWFQAVLEKLMVPTWEERKEQAGQGTAPPRLIVITEPGAESMGVVKDLVREYGAIVRSRSVGQDLAALVRSSRLIMSCSTFSFWGAALQKKQEVFVPLFGSWDPQWPVANAPAEDTCYDPQIAAWRLHSLYELPTTPKGFVREYR